MPNLDSLQDVVWAITGVWFWLKTSLELGIGVDDNVLHLVGGVVLQLVFCALFRLPLASWWPWLAVCVLELLNEANDIYWAVIAGDATVRASVVDFAMTMTLPTVLVLAARRARGTQEAEAAEPASG